MDGIDASNSVVLATYLIFICFHIQHTTTQQAEDHLNHIPHTWSLHGLVQDSINLGNQFDMEMA